MGKPQNLLNRILGWETPHRRPVKDCGYDGHYEGGNCLIHSLFFVFWMLHRSSTSSYGQRLESTAVQASLPWVNLILQHVCYPIWSLPASNKNGRLFPLNCSHVEDDLGQLEWAQFICRREGKCCLYFLPTWLCLRLWSRCLRWKGNFSFLLLISI